MKRLLLAACLLALPLASHAQSAVPGQITYQGKVSDAAGALIGSPTPVNRIVIFRVYDHGTSVAPGNRLHTEQQTVTIANGEFNVLIGTGSAVSGETFVASLDTVFNGTTRYLGVTVDDGNAGTVDPEISPRQQIVAMPYAFRSKIAESVTNGAATGNIFQSSGNVGIGTNAPAAPLTLFSSASDAKFLLQTPATGTTAFDGLAVVHSNAGYIMEYEAVPLYFGTSAAVRMAVAANGYVGIGTGTAQPQSLLSLGVSTANTKLALWDDSTGGLYGMGVQGNQFRLHTNQTGDRFSFLSSPTGNEVFTIKSTGQVGIGITAPIVPLQIYTPDNNTSIMLQHAGTGTTLQSGLGLIESNKGYLWQYSNLPLLIGTNGTTRMTFTADGKVAVGGGENPGALFSLGADLANTKLAVFDNGSGAMMGFGIQSSQFRFHVNQASDRYSFFDSAAGSEIMSLTGLGRLGLGIANPGAKLSLGSDLANTKMALWESGASVYGIGLQSNQFRFHLDAPTARFSFLNAPAGTEILQINGDGRMGFNSVNNDPNVGHFFSTTTGYMMVIAAGTTWKYAFDNAGTATKWGGASTWAVNSDARLKKNIDSLTGSLDRLLSLRSVTFDWKDEKIDPARQTGFIAQEVQLVFPDWVKTGPSGTLTVEHKGFEAHTVQAIRELRAEKDTQLAQRDAKIAALEARVRDLEGETSTRLAAIERRLNATAVTANSPR